uniref:Cytochrome P450 n=2 Tax=Agrobacterium rosae TaxID=1972867 RepID=A0AAW9FG12_9HYPH|nr:cytochrome P450 [Agrobacterium rosae]MDX8305552.1 cytochrome P450 [Agrobacterium rosae]
MSMQACPVFDANSDLYRSIGVLKVIETAVRKHGDIVILHTRDDRDTYLLSGQQSVRFWHEHAAHLPSEIDDARSSPATTHVLLGDGAQGVSWAQVGVPLRRKLKAIAGDMDQWFEENLKGAAAAFLDEAQTPVPDLLQLCRHWSVRSLCHTIFGTAFPDTEFVDGLIQVQLFHRFMYGKTTATLQDAEKLQEYQETRAFLDRVVRTNIASAQPGDRTVLASLLEAMPAGIDLDTQIDHLRPVLFRILFEKLSFNGLNLFWALVHLAQNPELADAIAAEAISSSADDADAYPLSVAAAKETLRLYPEYSFIYRRTKQDLPFGEVMIPSQSTILISPWLLHRDERYWRRPTHFDGQRFAATNDTPACYLPFGIGPKALKQRSFALCQIAVSLRAICAAVAFSLSPECPPGNLRPFLRSELAPRGAVPVIFKRRSETQASTLN